MGSDFCFRNTALDEGGERGGRRGLRPRRRGGDASGQGACEHEPRAKDDSEQRWKRIPEGGQEPEAPRRPPRPQEAESHGREPRPRPTQHAHPDSHGLLMPLALKMAYFSTLILCPPSSQPHRR